MRIEVKEKSAMEIVEKCKKKKTLHATSSANYTI
jgi:hypothetical protein